MRWLLAIAIAFLCCGSAYSAITERYVTSAAAGGGAGTSGDPWTLAEGLNQAVAGDRVNIQSDGAYSIGVSSVTNAGTATSAIIFRGYNSTIGDLVAVGRPGPGEPLTVTDFPVITLTGILSSNNYVHWENLNFTTAGNNYWSGTGTYNRLFRCKMEYTGAVAAGGFRAFGNYSSVRECDIVTNATGSYTALATRNDFVDCIFDCGGAGADGIQMTGFANVSHCIIYDCADGIIQTTSADRFDHVSIYNASSDGIYVTSADAAGGSDSIIYGCGGYGILFSATSQASNALFANIAIGNTTSGAIGNQGDNPGIRNEITLTANPYTTVTAGSEDWRPNNTAGGGALVRGESGMGNDLGALQHADAGGGGTSQLVNGGLVK